MSDDDTDPIQVLSTTLFEKEWGTALPPRVVDIFDALLSDGSHVRPAIDALLRRSSAYPEGLESSPWEEQGAWPNLWASRLDIPHTHTLGSLLDLLVACDVVTIDARGEYSLNPLAPHASFSYERADLE